MARNRAARYARRRRIPKPFRPLIVVFVFVGLIFERPPVAIWLRSGRPERSAKQPLPFAEFRDSDRAAEPYDTRSASGDPKPQYRPPADFLATDKEVAQIVAFLVRNRGRLDNEAVRAKWRTLDRVSLPLAIFLREIEAASAWDDLETEIAAAPPGTPAAPGSGLPRSIRHRKILRLMPEWIQRGEDILSPEPAANDNPAATPDVDNDDPDKKPPRP